MVVTNGENDQFALDVGLLAASLGCGRAAGDTRGNCRFSPRAAQ